LRLVRTVKNRFGPADEVGCFDLTDDGITGLADPSQLFLAHADDPVPGTCVTVSLEGRRALVCEVQALVGTTDQQGAPRRATSGLDYQRVAMLLAVLERRAALTLSRREVYAATVGGVRLSDPAADLALAIAVAGAFRNRAAPARVAAVGEVGLAGEIRPVTSLKARVGEAARLGFDRVLVPPGQADAVAGVEVVAVPNLDAALRAALEV
jgi:DNA repair protein RadA/Sms